MKVRWPWALLWASFAGAADLPGSADLPVLPRFPEASIVEYQQAADAERVYPLGAVRRIAGRLRMDDEASVRGALVAVTYQLPPPHEGFEAFTRSRHTLVEQQGELLYWCEGRDCGASNLWANAIFGQSRLYGPENQQAYLLARLPGTPEALIALYSITRGNGRAYLHVEWLQPEQPLGEILPTAATLMRQLREADVLRLPRLPEVPGDAWLGVLVRLLQQDSTMRVALSGRAAPAWYAALVEQGVKARRLEVDRDELPGLQLRRLR